MSELEQTIEELEAEVLAELEEANGDAPKKGAMPAQKSEIEKTDDGETDEEDLGGSADDGTKAADAVAKTADKIKPAKKAASIAPMKPEKLAAGDEVDHDGEDLEEAKSLTKAQHLEAIGKMKKAEIEEMIAAHQTKVEEATKAESEEELKALETAKAEIEEKIKSISVKEDVEALTEGEELSEEFKEKDSYSI